MYLATHFGRVSYITSFVRVIASSSLSGHMADTAAKKQLIRKEISCLTQSLDSFSVALQSKSILDQVKVKIIRSFGAF